MGEFDDDDCPTADEPTFEDGPFENGDGTYRLYP